MSAFVADGTFDLDVWLPEAGHGPGLLLIPEIFGVGAYAAGMAFFSAERHLVTPALARLAAAEGLTIVGWREVPFDITACGDGARAELPDVLQLFVAGAGGQRGMELERMAFCLRKRAEHEDGGYFASLSARTIVYKGMLSAPQLGPFYPDLSDPAYKSTLALVHSRFSTNTFPSWPLAHPYRYIAHNGEINTLRGNVNWMHARESMFKSRLFGDDLQKCIPVIDTDSHVTEPPDLWTDRVPAIADAPRTRVVAASRNYRSAPVGGAGRAGGRGRRRRRGDHVQRSRAARRLPGGASRSIAGSAPSSPSFTALSRTPSAASTRERSGARSRLCCAVDGRMSWSRSRSRRRRILPTLTHRVFRKIR